MSEFFDGFEAQLRVAVVRETGPARLRRRRRGLLELAVAGLGVAGAAAVALVLTGAGGGTSLAQAAAAKLAVPKDGILVTSYDVRQTFRGRRTHVRRTQWIDGKTTRTHTTGLNLKTGRVSWTTDSLVGPHVMQGYSSEDNTLSVDRLCGRTLAIHQDTEDPVAVTRRALKDGKLRDAGTTTFDGRRLHKLVPAGSLATFVKRNPGVMVMPGATLVDPRTYETVATVGASGDGRTRSVIRFTGRKVLPRTKANLALLAINSHPTARRVYRGKPC